MHIYRLLMPSVVLQRVRLGKSLVLAKLDTNESMEYALISMNARKKMIVTQKQFVQIQKAVMSVLVLMAILAMEKVVNVSY